jgi:pyridoxamine 5'-phosphate oxidase
MNPVNATLESLRVSYQGAPFDIADCDTNPEIQYNAWLKEALNAQIEEPNAFVLSTVTKDLRPRARVLLLKGIHDHQFVFYTNYDSDKGHEIENNPRASLTFLWLPLGRQIRIEGVLKKVDASLSDDYFQKRPRGSQIGAIASPQSRKIPSRAELEKYFKDAEAKFSQAELPRPSNWGGYGLVPDYYEFWQGRDNRMHDRISYAKTVDGWTRSRLAP